MKPWTVGVDLGGTKFKVGRIAPDGALLEEQTHETRMERGAASIIADIAAAISGLTKGEPAVVGIGVAGQVDPVKGHVHFAPNLKWHNVPLKAELERATGSPVSVLNDVRAATWGEWHFGAGRDCEDFVCLFLGTGVGGGIVSGGQLLTGSNHTAGELGHLVVDFNGPLCGCGNYGCLEAFTGGVHLAARAQEAIRKDPQSGSALLALGEVSARTVFQTCSEGDPLGKELVNQASQALIAGLVSTVHAFNPARLILGGGMVASWPDLLPTVRAAVFKKALPAACEKLEIVLATLENRAALIGAATFASRNS